MSYLITNERISRQGHEELFQLSYLTADQLVTDSAELAEFGIDQAAIDEYKNLSNSFNTRDFDEKFVFIQKLRTDTKKKAGIELMKSIFKLQTQVNLEWFNFGIDLTVFDFGSISNETELELILKAKAVINLLKDSNELTISQELLSELSQNIIAFEKANLEQYVAKAKRKIATKLRQAQANELFLQTRKFRELGKRMWLLKGDQVRSDAYLMPNDKGKPESEADIGEPSQPETTQILTDYNTENS